MILESKRPMVFCLFLCWNLAACTFHDNPNPNALTDEGESDTAVIDDTNIHTDTGIHTDTAPDTVASDSDSIDHTDSDTVMDTEVDTSGCGNGVIEYTEVCDDGNSASGDGCSAMCDVVEDGFACLFPGETCISTVVCGDGWVSGNETCDDSNTNNMDGCSSDCKLESGWLCSVPGEACTAMECGDGIIAGTEECDDGNDISDDGCSDVCTLEDGWACDSQGESCHETVCNDGIREGKEPCDDGNNVVGDGCTPFCEIEPDCSNGACVSACGDGIILAGDDEECDDGNFMDNDGCSSDCKVEEGFICNNVEEELPSELQVPITYRDFIAVPKGEGERHPDFEMFRGSSVTPNMVTPELGDDGKPLYTGVCEEGNMVGDCPNGAQTTSEENFNHWYNDVPTFNQTKVAKLSLEQQSDNTYYFSDDEFFPLDNDGWVAEGKEKATYGHNFGFTSELRYWFKFNGGEFLRFSGDDDVWVFINNQRVVDIGGSHNKVSKKVTLDNEMADTLDLEKGRIYEIVLFHAERHTDASHYNLTLSGFTSTQSECQSICGDGIVTANESCDDGINDGSYGSCESDCTQGPGCGDGTIDPQYEECDDGINLGVYSVSNEPGCAPGCKLGSFCGDGVLNSLFGEQCDDGENQGGYGQCGQDCRLGIRCGDGIVQSDQGEECDDGNNVSGDGCSSTCLNDAIVII